MSKDRQRRGVSARLALLHLDANPNGFSESGTCGPPHERKDVPSSLAAEAIINLIPRANGERGFSPSMERTSTLEDVSGQDQRTSIFRDDPYKIVSVPDLIDDVFSQTAAHGSLTG